MGWDADAPNPMTTDELFREALEAFKGYSSDHESVPKDDWGYNVRYEEPKPRIGFWAKVAMKLQKLS